ncbi:MAG TPA: hypothetical protein DCG69_10400 [Bacteroidales bacterium]|nr:hypothetical protein [Bacteroidales bacterium]
MMAVMSICCLPEYCCEIIIGRKQAERCNEIRLINYFAKRIGQIGLSNRTYFSANRYAGFS